MSGIIEGADYGLPPGPWQMEPCKACKSPMFDQRFIMMHQSGIIATDGKDKTALHPVMTCCSCGWVHGSPVEENGPPTVEGIAENLAEDTPDNIHVFNPAPTTPLIDDNGPPPLTG